MIVSHDRAALERLTSYTVRVHHGRVTWHRGSYGVARASWEATEHTEHETAEKLKHERKKQKKRLADKRQARAVAERGKSTSKNMKNIHDSDARLRYKAKRRRSAEVSLGRDIQLTRRCPWNKLIQCMRKQML